MSERVNSQSRTWASCYDQLREALVREQAKRSHRRHTMPSGELAWVARERAVMHAEVNRLRADLGRPEVDEQSVRRAENSACGHSDYTSKFAIYCADLVLEDA